MSIASPSVLLDPAASARRARPLHHWSRARQESVRSHFEEVHRAWCTDWLPGGASVSGDAEVWISDSEAETALTPEDATIFWSFVDSTVVMPGYHAVHAIARAMFGADATREMAGMADGVARAAWADWLRRLTAAPVPAASELQEVDPPKGRIGSTPWSGALWLRWRWCGGLWRLALPHEVAAAWANPESERSSASALAAPSATGLNQALAREQITLRAVLGGTELNLGQLQSLCVGDVIPLEHPLDAPLKVITAEGAELCDGWLGRRHGHIAVEMAMPAAKRQSNNPSLKEKNP